MEKQTINDKTKTPVDPIATARAVLEADRRQRAEACSGVIVNALEKYGCHIAVNLARQPDGTFRSTIVIEAA